MLFPISKYGACQNKESVGVLYKYQMTHGHTFDEA